MLAVCDGTKKVQDLGLRARCQGLWGDVPHLPSLPYMPGSTQMATSPLELHQQRQAKRNNILTDSAGSSCIKK